MSSNYASYQSGASNQDSDAPTTPEQARIAHDQARQPGVVRYSGGEVTIEQPVQVKPSTSVAERATRWRDNLEDSSGRRVDFSKLGSMSDGDVFVYLSDGDRVPLDVAKRIGEFYTNANGRLVARAEGNRPTDPADGNRPNDQQESQKQKDQKDENAAPQPGDVFTPPQNVQDNMSELQSIIGEAQVSSIFTQLAEGQSLSENRYEEIAQVIGGGIEPNQVKAIIQRDSAVYVKAANDAIALEGVPDSRATAFREWMFSSEKGKAMDAVYAMQGGDMRPLRALARSYVKQHAMGLKDRDLDGRSLAPRIEGTTWSKGHDGSVMLDIPGHGRMSALTAIREGLVELEDAE